MKAKIAFRVDASLEIGTGHVIRCLTLAEALRHQNFECLFICREKKSHLKTLIEACGFECQLLPTETPEDDASTTHSAWLGVSQQEDAAQTENVLKKIMPEWLIVDHYSLDSTWENMLRAFAKKIMVIDDLADRSHSCDLLLDQNLGRKDLDYDSRLDNGCLRLIGPDYALLRPEFLKIRDQSLLRRGDGKLNRILISLGGADPSNISSKVLELLAKTKLPVTTKIHLVLGELSPWRDELLAQASRMPFETKVLVGVSDMASLMAEADLGIGAAGTSSWERCCLGLPTLLVVLAQNQKLAAKALSDCGAALLLGEKENFQNDFDKVFSDLLKPNQLSQMSQSAAHLVDGRGTQRVIEKILSL